MWPQSVTVKNMPFHLQGWNGEYVCDGKMKEDAPVYRLNPYTYLLFFDIIGVQIEKTRDCDSEPVFFRNSEKLFGSLYNCHNDKMAEIVP